MSEAAGGDELARFVAGLRTRTFGRAARLYRSCGSTNDEAAAWARDPSGRAPEGAVVMADEQSRGRGRLGRVWHSPAGESLYLTLVLRPPLSPLRAPPLALMAAVALGDAIEEQGLAPELKWPNDVLLHGRKAAGILTEMATSGRGIEHVLVGIGVNLHGTTFPDELAARATSLALALRQLPGRQEDTEGAEGPDRDSFAAALLGHLEAWYERFLAYGPSVVVAAWKRRARVLGERVQIMAGSERHAGIAEDVDDEGALVLRADDGRRVRVLAGEIVERSGAATG